MNFQDILTCLEDMEAVKMNKPPKDIFETTILQHTFKFCDPYECFLQFRQVCKSWQNAVETIKFDQYPRLYITQYPHHSAFVSKFLPMFKKLKIRVSDPIFQSEEVRNLFLRNIANLNEIHIPAYNSEFANESFIKQLYKNSIDTLKLVDHKGSFFPDLQFPKVTEIELGLSLKTKTTFVPTLLNVLKNMEKIKIIRIYTWTGFQNVYEFIGQNYAQHCISSHGASMLDYFPLKICYLGSSLSAVDNKKHNFEIEYFTAFIQDLGDPTDGNWDRYEDILDQLTKLKKVAFANDGGDIMFDWFEENDIPKVWTDMLQYLKKREIEIVLWDEILNQDLFNKVAKEVGATWRFEFD